MEKKKKRSLVSRLFGMESIKQGAVMTGSLVKNSVPSKKELIKETYESALKRNGISKSEENPKMLSLYKGNALQGYFMFFLSMFVLYTSLSKFYIYGTNEVGNVLPALSYLSLSIAFLSVSINYLFRSFQLRYKRLGMLKYWLLTPREWFAPLIKTNRLVEIDNFKEKNPNHKDLTDKEYIEKIRDCLSNRGK